MGKSRRRICIDCGMMFTLNVGEPNRTERCYECNLKNKEKAWREEMRKLGCNVGDPKRLGEIPLINSRKKYQCPKVIINGEKYREVNGLLFDTDREVKTYPNKDEWREIKKKKEEEVKEKEEKERLKELEEKIRKELHEVSLKERVQQMMVEGSKRGAIASKLKISLYMVDKISKELIAEGKASPFIGLIYSDETNEKIIAMAKQGKSYGEISEAVDKPYKGVQGKILKWKKEGVV